MTFIEFRRIRLQTGRFRVRLTSIWLLRRLRLTFFSICMSGSVQVLVSSPVSVQRRARILSRSRSLESHDSGEFPFAGSKVVAADWANWQVSPPKRKRNSPENSTLGGLISTSSLRKTPATCCLLSFGWHLRGFGRRRDKRREIRTESCRWEENCSSAPFPLSELKPTLDESFRHSNFWMESASGTHTRRQLSTADQLMSSLFLVL